MSENNKSRAQLSHELEEAHRRIAELEASSVDGPGANAPAGKVTQHNTSLLRSIAENLPNSYLSIVNRDLTIGFTSGQGFNKLGLDARQFIGMTLEEVFGDSAALVRGHYEQTFSGEKCSFELSINDQHQQYRTVPLLDEDGAVSHILAVVEDITDRKLAEEKLRRNEARFRRMFEKNSAVMLLIEPDGGQIVDANAAAAKFYGYSRAALMEMCIQDINQFSPDRVARDRHLAVNEQKNCFIFQHRQRSGEVRQVEVHSTPLEILGKVHLFSIIHDITLREEAAQQLRESEEKFRSYVQNAPYGLFVADERGRYLEVNRMASEITGYSEQELLEMTIADLLPPGSQVAGDSHFNTVMETGIAIGDGPFVTKSGQVRFWTVRAVKLSDTRILGFVSDITERMDHQQRLQEEKERVQLYLDTASIMLLGLDTEGRITLVNQRGCDLLSVESQEQLLGQDWFQFIPREDRDKVRRIHQANIEGATVAPRRIEGRIITARGEPKWIVWNNAVVRDPQGNVTGSFSSGEDVTAHREMQAQLAQADRLSSMGMLAAGVAHEINNPLSYLLYNLDSVSNDLPGLLDAIRVYQAQVHDRFGAEVIEQTVGDAAQRVNPAVLGEIHARIQEALEGALRIREITRGLGTFSRVEPDQLVPVHLRDVIEAALSMCFNEIKYRAQVVKDYGKVPTVTGSEGRLSQVFLNLLVNAAQAINEGDVENNQIRVRTWAEGGAVYAEVHDTGKGVAPEHIDRLFDPFFTTKEIGVGSGLGLPISKGIVESYGGAITVESRVDEGTTFVIRIPARAVVVTPHPGIEAARDEEQVRGRILIVDDEAKLRAAMARMLGHHDTVEADTGEAARQILEADQGFDLIICDMMMPRGSGMDLHAWLSEAHPRLAEQVIFITGGAFTPKARDYMAQIKNVRLEKPFDVANFKKIVDERVNVSRRRGHEEGS